MAVKGNRRKISVDGKVYDSMWVASKELDISYPTLQGRLNSESGKFKDWVYVDGKPAPRGRVAPQKVRPKLPGCYRLRNEMTGEFYIGSSNDLPGRKADHLHKLRHDKHSNQRLQDAWNMSREEDWTWKFFVTHDREQAFQMEQMHISQNTENTSMLNSSKDVTSPLHGNDKYKVARKTIEQKLREGEATLAAYRERRESGEDYYIEKRRSVFIKPVIVDGIRYSSTTLASVVTGMDNKKIMRRARSEKKEFEGYCWAKPEETDMLGIVRRAEPEDYIKGGLEPRRKLLGKSKGLILVTHTPTGKVYVAGSVNVYRILNEQEKKLARGKHDNRALQSLYDTQGSKVEVEVIEVEDDDCVLAAKQQMILQLGRACLNGHVFYSETA